MSIFLALSLTTTALALMFALATIFVPERLKDILHVIIAALLWAGAATGLVPAVISIGASLLTARSLMMGDLAQAIMTGATAPTAEQGGILFIIAALSLILGSKQTKEAWSRLNPPSRAVQNGPWRAGWADAADAAVLRRNEAGLPVGVIGNGVLRYQPDEDNDWAKGHHAVIAGTRAGKGVSAVIPAILDHEGPALVLDVKGELYRACQADRARHRQQIILDPFGVTGAQTSLFDPLSYVRDGMFDRDLPVLVDGLIRPESSDNRWISNQAADLVAASITVVLGNAEGRDRRLIKAMEILQEGSLQTFEAWRDTPGLEDRVHRAAAAFLAAGDRQRGTVLSYIRENLAWADGERMRRLMGRSTISLDQILHGDADLYVVVPPDLLGYMSGFLRLMTNLLLGAAIRRGTDANDPELLVVADEFTRCGRMEKVLDIATIAAGYNLKALFLAQDLQSIDTVYSRAERGTILGSCATIRVHGLGAGDLDTAEWVSRALGQTTVQTRSTTNDQTTFGEAAAPLMSPDEILRLPYQEQILLVRGRAAHRINRIISHQHLHYRDRIPNQE